MNKSRRKEIQRIIEELLILQIDIEIVRDEERSAIDNLPESFRGSDKESKMEDYVGYLEEAHVMVDDVIDELNKCL